MSDKFKELIQSEIPVVIDFYATWCQPCKIQSSVLTEVKKNIGETARIIKIDVDQYPTIAAQYEIRSIPTLMIFKKGEQLFRHSGVIDLNSLTAEIQRHQ